MNGVEVFVNVANLECKASVWMFDNEITAISLYNDLRASKEMKPSAAFLGTETKRTLDGMVTIGAIQSNMVKHEKQGFQALIELERFVDKKDNQMVLRTGTPLPWSTIHTKLLDLGKDQKDCLKLTFLQPSQLGNHIPD